MSDQSHTILEVHGKNFKFPKDFGHNVIFDYEYECGKTKENYKLKSRFPECDLDKPREAVLEVFSYLYSLGAVHHYAHIDLGYPRYVYASNGKHYGYMVSDRYGLNLPFGVTHLKIELTRLVDKRDLKHDKDQAEYGDSFLYGRMKRGDYTHGFWTEEEAKEAALTFFKKHFDKGWILVPTYWEHGERPILATT